jgi:putative aminopeptidase FrvX
MLAAHMDEIGFMIKQVIKGPTMVLSDARMIPHLRLRDLVVDTNRAAGIPLQTSFFEGGATDGAPIHLHHSGVSTVVLGVAARHIPSHSSIIHQDDLDHQVALVAALVRKLDSTTVANLAA